MAARVSSVDAQNFRFSRSMDEEAVMAARVPRARSGSQNLRRRVDIFRRQRRRVAARGRASGDRISRFSSREAEEHACGVGFDWRSLDVHRSEKLSHGFA